MVVRSFTLCLNKNHLPFIGLAVAIKAKVATTTISKQNFIFDED